MKTKLKVVSALIILLSVFIISCGDTAEWELEYETQHADGCTTARYKKVLWDRVEYKEEVTCPNGEIITETWTEYD